MQVFGIINFVLGVIWLGFIIFADERIPVTSKIVCIYLLIFGILYFIGGSGVAVSRWFGEAYIKIDNKRICIKKGVFSKKWVLFWDQIDR